jgi:hypothetical protein
MDITTLLLLPLWRCCMMRVSFGSELISPTPIQTTSCQPLDLQCCFEGSIENIKRWFVLLLLREMHGVKVRELIL